MKRPVHFRTLQSKHIAMSRLRREVMHLAIEAQSKAKRAIFALHRDDKAGARVLLGQAQEGFVNSERAAKRTPEMLREGSYRAALEEYAEACLFERYLETGQMTTIDARAMDPTIYLGGLCDTTGEMVRYAVRQVTLGHTDSVKDVCETVSMVLEFLLDLDLTGYLRTKFDQAKKNGSRLEEMLYDLSLRRPL